jgi:xanthine dehydrogenase accessory factor
VVTHPFDAARDLLEERLAGAMLTSLGDGSKAVIDADGQVVAGSVRGGEEVIMAAMGMIGAGRSGIVPSGSGEVFVEVLDPEPRLLIFGAGPIAEALCAMASIVGFTVQVGDPRPAFARKDRFPQAAEIRLGWPGDLVAEMAPDQSTYAVSLLHEARFEDELLPALLRSEARYLGALGSLRTHAARSRRLEQAGFGAADIARIRGPVGLDIGAATPAEIAVAILAELISARRGAHRPLRSSP